MSDNGFLPDDYEQPKGASPYMKFQEGENRFRILSKPIIGWEDWTEDKKPIRFHFNEKPDKSINPKKAVKHFWAMIVYNYATKDVNILQITQATIQAAITNLIKDAEWGAPYDYDLKVTRSGEGMDTEYSVAPSPHKPLTREVIEAFTAKPCSLEKLFTNGDPFETKVGDTLMATDLPL